MRAIYTMLSRPVSSFTLPSGITTEWVRLPRLDGHTMRHAFPDVETSEHLYGEFTANRILTPAELERFQVRRIDAEHIQAQRISELEKRIETLRGERTTFAEDGDEVSELTQMIETAQAELKNARQPADGGQPANDANDLLVAWPSPPRRMKQARALIVLDAAAMPDMTVEDEFAYIVETWRDLHDVELDAKRAEHFSPDGRDADGCDLVVDRWIEKTARILAVEEHAFFTHATVTPVQVHTSTATEAYVVEFGQEPAEKHLQVVIGATEPSGRTLDWIDDTGASPRARRTTAEVHRQRGATPRRCTAILLPAGASSTPRGGRQRRTGTMRLRIEQTGTTANRRTIAEQMKYHKIETGNGPYAKRVYESADGQWRIVRVRAATPWPKNEPALWDAQRNVNDEWTPLELNATSLRECKARIGEFEGETTGTAASSGNALRE